MRWTLLFVCLLAAPAGAQVYKCVVNGKTQYAERPCAPDAKALRIQDDLTPERQQEALDIARRERGLRAGIEADELYDKAQRIREAGAQKAAQRLQQGRCDQLVRTAKDAKDESNKWRYHQGLIDDAKRRQKEAEDAHFSDCYGSN